MFRSHLLLSSAQTSKSYWKRKYQQFLTYMRAPFLKLLRNPKCMQIGIDTTPTYLSCLIIYVALYVFKMPVCVFKILFLILFSYEKHKLKCFIISLKPVLLSRPDSGIQGNIIYYDLGIRSSINAGQSII
jgi:hypothetical protein